MAMLGEWLTPAQAARELQLTPQRVRQVMREGRLHHQVTPLGRLVRTEAVRELKERRNEPEYPGAA